MVKHTVLSRAARIHAHAYNALQQSKLLCRRNEFQTARQILEDAIGKIDAIGQFVEELAPEIYQYIRKILAIELQDIADAVNLREQERKFFEKYRPLIFEPQKVPKQRKSPQKSTEKPEVGWLPKLFHNIFNFFTTWFYMLIGVELWQSYKMAKFGSSTSDRKVFALDSLPTKLLVKTLQYLEFDDAQRFAKTSRSMKETFEKHFDTMKKGRIDRMEFRRNRHEEFIVETYLRERKLRVHKLQKIDEQYVFTLKKKYRYPRCIIGQYEYEESDCDPIMQHLSFLTKHHTIGHLKMGHSRCSEDEANSLLAAMERNKSPFVFEKLSIEFKCDDDFRWIVALIERILKSAGGSIGELCLRSWDVISSQALFQFITTLVMDQLVIPVMELNFSVDDEKMAAGSFSKLVKEPVVASVACALMLNVKWFDYGYKRVCLPIVDTRDYWRSIYKVMNLKQKIVELEWTDEEDLDKHRTVLDNKVLLPKPFERSWLTFRSSLDYAILEDYSMYLMSDKCEDGIVAGLIHRHERLVELNFGVVETQSEDFNDFFEESREWAETIDELMRRRDVRFEFE